MMDLLRRLLGGSQSEPDGSAERERRDLRSATLPDGQRHLIQGPQLEVVGESQYRPVFSKMLGRKAEGHLAIVDAAMVWEPKNKYDPNAIAIQVGGVTCGYLVKADAKRYRPVMERCRDQGFTPVVRGDIRGGFRQDDGTWAHYGIVLYVASPEKILNPGSTKPT